MQNVAKINLELSRCTDCPYCRKLQGYADYFCQHDLATPGIEVGDGELVPDFCPFVIERLKKVLDTIKDGTSTTIPKKYLNQIEKKQKDDPDPKFGADHSFAHITRVIDIGNSFFDECFEYGYTDSNKVLKERYLFSIAVYLHDIGLADSSRNHDIHSAELAKKYLSGPKVDIDLEDAYTIVHAIGNHSKGEETRTIIDAALILADKLDVTKHRIVRVTSPITKELLKVEKIDFELSGKKGKVELATLRYTTNGDFDALSLREWPKCVSIPMMVAKKFLKVPNFQFIVDGVEINVKEIIG